MAWAIEVNGVEKTYGSRNGTCALRGVSLTVAEGELYALLGLNGAGKSTLTKIILGLSRATSGCASLLGAPSGGGQWRGHVGYLPEVFAPTASSGSARTLLRYLGGLDGLRGKGLEMRITEVLDITDLAGVADRSPSTYSKGMLRRLGIAQAVLGSPKVLFLDEPAEGLDPVAMKNLRVYLQELKGNGTSVLMNSHLLSEVERVADRIGILHGGRLAAEGSLHELTSGSLPTLEAVFAHHVERKNHDQ